MIGLQIRVFVCSSLLFVFRKYFDFLYSQPKSTPALQRLFSGQEGKMDFLKFAQTIVEKEFVPAPNPGQTGEKKDRDAYVQQCEKAVPSDVRMFSGCKDHQTSADVSNIASFGLPETSGPAGAGGACTNSMMLALQQNPDLTWVQLLDEMRKILKQKGYSQIPELSASRDLDLNEKFSVLNPQGGGKKKALLIGINYTGMKGELSGCINDVKRMEKFVKDQGYVNVVILTDESENKPTYKNIMNALLWLADGAAAGDSLFMHYSGHGGRLEDQDGDEKDGYDETMVPLDYQKAGQMRDDDIFKALIAPLPAGVHLTVVMDCCHSGSILDLPFMLMGDDAHMEAFENGEEMTMDANPGFNLEFVLAIAKQLYTMYTQSGGDPSQMKDVGTALFASCIGGGAGGTKSAAPTKSSKKKKESDMSSAFGFAKRAFW